jgi:hypothetical protein
MSSSTLTIDQLKRAVAVAEQIQQLESELARLLGSSGGTPAKAAPAAKPPGKTGGRRKRTMSPEARERIAAAQRARWAKVKGTQPAAKAAVKAAKPAKKGGLTPEGRAKLAAAMKARWAARRKGSPAPNAKK